LDDKHTPEGDHQSPQPKTPPIYKSEELLKGHKEIRILHGDETYRLRLTSRGKLILHK